MELMSEEQFNTLPKEACYLLYQMTVQQMQALEASNEQLSQKIDDLQESIQVLIQQRFGRKSEKTQITGQYEMALDAAGNLILNEVEKLAEAGKPEEPEETEIVSSVGRRSGNRRTANLRGAKVVEDPAVELPEEKLTTLFLTDTSGFRTRSTPSWITSPQNSFFIIAISLFMRTRK